MADLCQEDIVGSVQILKTAGLQTLRVNKVAKAGKHRQRAGEAIQSKRSVGGTEQQAGIVSGIHEHD